MSSANLEPENAIAEAEFDRAIDAASVPPIPIEMPRRSSLFYLIGALAGGNLLSSALRMCGGMLQARCVDKVTLGTFTGITLALNWSLYLQLGILNGLNRELPYFFGRGDQVRVRQLAATARAWAVCMGVLVECAFAGKAIWCFWHGQTQLGIGWMTHAGVAVMTFYSTSYLMATYRTAHDFARLSLANVVQNAMGVACVIFVYWSGFNGICLRAELSMLAGVLVLHLWRPIRVPWQWSFGDFKHLLAIGFPIFIVGELGSRLLFLIDSTLVSHYLQAGGLGLYNVVGFAREAAEVVPLAVGSVMYPRMTEYFGRTHDLPGTMWMTFRPTVYLVAGMAVMIAAGWVLAWPVTKRLLPGYIEAVPAMRWSLLLPLVLSFGCVHNVYNICRRQDLYAIVIVLSMASYAGTLVVLCRHGAYLSAFPQSLLVQRIVYIVGGYIFLIPVYRSWKKQQNLAGGAAV